MKVVFTIALFGVVYADVVEWGDNCEDIREPEAVDGGSREVLPEGIPYVGEDREACVIGREGGGLGSRKHKKKEGQTQQKT